jgi:hypothetical protein
LAATPPPPETRARHKALIVEAFCVFSKANLRLDELASMLCSAGPMRIALFLHCVGLAPTIAWRGPGALRKNFNDSMEHEGISVFARKEDDPIDAIPENPVTAAIERHFR